jgi:hypothetical protein
LDITILQTIALYVAQFRQLASDHVNRCLYSSVLESVAALFVFGNTVECMQLLPEVVPLEKI